MGLLKEFLDRRNANKRRFQEYEDNDRVVNVVEERKKSHNERELIQILENERQQNIKDALRWEDKKRIAQEKLKSRGMMKFNPEFFNNDESNILRQKNLFLNGGNF